MALFSLNTLRPSVRKCEGKYRKIDLKKEVNICVSLIVTTSKCYKEKGRTNIGPQVFRDTITWRLISSSPQDCQLLLVTLQAHRIFHTEILALLDSSVSNTTSVKILSTKRLIVPPYTECPRRNVRDFGRVFLMLNYTDIIQNTYIHS